MEILGTARNFDVFATELLQPARAALPPEAGLADLAAALDEARQAAYERVDQAILSERHAAGMLRLSHWFEARGWRERASPTVRFADRRRSANWPRACSIDAGASCANAARDSAG